MLNHEFRVTTFYLSHSKQVKDHEKPESVVDYVSVRLC